MAKNKFTKLEEKNSAWYAKKIFVKNIRKISLQDKLQKYQRKNISKKYQKNKSTILSKNKLQRIPKK